MKKYKEIKVSARQMVEAIKADPTFIKDWFAQLEEDIKKHFTKDLFLDSSTDTKGGI